MRLKRLLCALAALLLLPTALGEATQGGEIAVPELNDICQYEIPGKENGTSRGGVPCVPFPGRRFISPFPP